MAYSSIADHSTMAFDSVRNETYARALRAVVRPDTVVLDLGAGLGLHGLCAAAAGAARVYLVEPEPVVEVALQVARAAGLAERIVVVRERIEEGQLPEKVDVIAHVFTGNLLFSEDLLPSLFTARDRYLRHGGVLLPDRAELWLAPLEATTLHTRHVAAWSSSVLGLDYSPVRRLAANEILWLRREEFRDSRTLGTGAVVAELDMMSDSRADCRGRVGNRVEASGTCHGLIGWIRIRVGTEWLSTGPDSPPVHWSQVMLPIDPPLELTAGDEVEVSLDRPAYGDWTWSIRSSGGSRRHSTFLAVGHGSSGLSRVAPGRPPGLSPAGLQVLRVLELARQGLTNSEIADALTQAQPLDPAQALRRVQAISMRYGRRE